MKPMKRLMMVIALAAAANFAAFGIPSASAVDAHHPAKQTTKAKKAKKAPAKSRSMKRSGMPMMNCPMMSSGMRKGMMRGGAMKCRMMGTAGSHRMRMMHGMGQR